MGPHVHVHVAENETRARFTTRIERASLHSERQLPWSDLTSFGLQIGDDSQLAVTVVPEQYSGINNTLQIPHWWIQCLTEAILVTLTRYGHHKNIPFDSFAGWLTLRRRRLVRFAFARTFTFGRRSIFLTVFVPNLPGHHSGQFKAL